MIRLAVLADVHANLPALEAVLADAELAGVDGTIVAGDFTCGSQSQEVIVLLRDLDAWLIRGNSEGYLLSFDRREVPDGWWKGEQWAFTRWSYRHLDQESMRFVGSLPEQRVLALDGADSIRVVHGSPSCPIEHLIPDRDRACVALFRRAGILPEGSDPKPLYRAVGEIDERVLVCGHSHIAWRQEVNGHLVLNPGSVGAPINGDPRAQYALLDWTGSRWQASLRMVAYDVGRIRTAFVRSGLLAEGGAFARACLLGIETGLNVPGALVAYVRSLADEDVGDDAWVRASETFDWGEYTDGETERAYGV